MAKKKKASRRVKKTTRRSASKSAKKPAKSKSPKRRSTGNTSVDAVLKRFTKERGAKEAQLDTLRKKKAEMQKRATKLREQIEKIADEERQMEAAISNLDGKRDREVSDLLATLGVQLSESSTGAGDVQQQGRQSGGKLQSARDAVTSALSKRRDERN